MPEIEQVARFPRLAGRARCRTPPIRGRARPRGPNQSRSRAFAGLARNDSHRALLLEPLSSSDMPCRNSLSTEGQPAVSTEAASGRATRPSAPWVAAESAVHGTVRGTPSDAGVCQTFSRSRRAGRLARRERETPTRARLDPSGTENGERSCSIAMFVVRLTEPSSNRRRSRGQRHLQQTCRAVSVMRHRAGMSVALHGAGIPTTPPLESVPASRRRHLQVRARYR